MSTVRFVTIGDSFSEGVGDELPDGTVRGWADLVAQQWATIRGEPISYANLAIRGRLIWPIVHEQLEPALALRPTHLSFVGGGNDVIRPRASIDHVADAFNHVIRRCHEEGVEVIVHTGANPSEGLPLARVIDRRGSQLAHAVRDRANTHPDVLLADHWADPMLGDEAYRAADRLHLNSSGHHRVAARVLAALGLTAPDIWWESRGGAPSTALSDSVFLRHHVTPWLQRRITGRSSGDHREPKHPGWLLLAPRAKQPE